jgi:predicted AAA+ superfamily ATPase
MTLHKFSHKSKERLRNEKCYLVDLAFASERENVFVGEDLGWRIENIVYLELIRRHKKLGREIFYFNKGYEIDFVVCSGNYAIELIQVSYSLENEKTRKREINALIKGSKELNCTKLTLLTLDDSENINLENGLKVEVKNLLLWLSLDDNEILTITV